MADGRKASVQTVSVQRVLSALETGTLEMKGRLPWGSNYTFLAVVRVERLSVPCVYKPTRGERPLWDFPSETLALREVAAYRVSEALGWGLVPPTAIRTEGPYGPGSAQLFVDAEDDSHYFTFGEEEKGKLRRVAAFDLLVNNADRKGGHVIRDRQGMLWLIDHGICFHEDPKLRTVIWDFAGEPVPADIVADVRRFQDALKADHSPLRDCLAQLLSPTEIESLCRRAERLIRHPKFPHPGPGRNYPWPAV